MLAGFTSVVGVQSSETTIKKESPLFNIRTKNSVNKKSEKVANLDYVGKGKNALINTNTGGFYDLLNLLKQNLKDDSLSTMVSLHDGCCPTQIPSSCLSCAIIGCVFIVIFALLMTILLPFCFISQLGLCPWDSDYQTDNGKFQELFQTQQNNPLFNKLVTEHPELIPEIMALNS